jgi:hypothetical protein
VAEIGAGLRFAQAVEGGPKQTGTDTSIAWQREARQRHGDEIQRCVADDSRAGLDGPGAGVEADWRVGDKPPPGSGWRSWGPWRNRRSPSACRP